jgi:hypothetical protein
MKQEFLGLGKSSKCIQRQEFPGELVRVVRWAESVSQHMSDERYDRPPLPCRPCRAFN